MKLTTLLISLFCLFLCLPAQSARVVKVKGRKVLVDSQGDNIRKGQLYYIMSKSGKKRGLIKVLKLKGKKVLAVMTKKSRAKRGWRLKLKRNRGGKRSALNDTSSLKNKSFWGIIGGMSMTTIDVKNIGDLNVPSSLNNSSLSGNGFSIKGLYDYALFKLLWFRATAGVEQFTGTSDNQVCSNDNGATFNSTCEIDIMYATADLWGRFLFSTGNFRPWVGAGVGLYFPATKEANALNVDNLSSSSVFSVGGGFDWKVGKNLWIPFQVEYNLFPESDTVSANSISFRTGISLPF